jgi:hypothetical protein
MKASLIIKTNPSKMQIRDAAVMPVRCKNGESKLLDSEIIKRKRELRKNATDAER